MEQLKGAQPNFKNQIPDILSGIEEILITGALTGGKHLSAFEASFSELIGVNHSIGVNSGGTGLELLVKALDIEGAEVIVPTDTFVASASAVARAGCLPVFADIGKDAVLDIGAGMGVFLHKFMDSSWQGTALEPDPNASSFMKKAIPKATVINGLIDQMEGEKKYELITMNRVLEHIYDPISFVEKCERLLKKDGLMYIEVPDEESYYSDGPNNEAFGYGHYHVYSESSFRKIEERTNFKLKLFKKVMEPSGKFTLYGFFGLE